MLAREYFLFEPLRRVAIAGGAGDVAKSLGVWLVCELANGALGPPLGAPLSVVAGARGGCGREDIIVGGIVGELEMDN